MAISFICMVHMFPVCVWCVYYVYCVHMAQVPEIKLK